MSASFGAKRFQGLYEVLMADVPVGFQEGGERCIVLGGKAEYEPDYECAFQLCGIVFTSGLLQEHRG